MSRGDDDDDDLALVGDAIYERSHPKNGNRVAMGADRETKIRSIIGSRSEFFKKIRADHEFWLAIRFTGKSRDPNHAQSLTPVASLVGQIERNGDNFWGVL